jgi:hypothetical protein
VRQTENLAARDEGEGSLTTTSEPGRRSLDAASAAQLLGVPEGSISISGPNAFITEGEGAVHRTDTVADAFVICLSELGNDPLLLSRFGGACVRISNPAAFVSLVDQALRRHVAPLVLNDCEVDTVEYRSRTSTFRDAPTKAGYFVKPIGGRTSFELEREVRIVWPLAGAQRIEPIVLHLPSVISLLARA